MDTGHPSPTFSLTVLGCAGGPLEGATSAFLLKPAWESFDSLLHKGNPQVLAIDAGAGLGQIAQLVQAEQLSRLESRASQLYEGSLRVDGVGLPSQPAFLLGTVPMHTSTATTANRILQLTLNYLITHPHLDHISALTINSPTFAGLRRHVWGIDRTLAALKTHIFNGVIWPDLVEEGFIDLNLLDNEHWSDVNDSFKVQAFPVSHGCIKGSIYPSSAFLIKIAKHEHYLLSFGDIESDFEIAADSSVNRVGNSNLAVWQSVAPLITQGNLKAIIIECSTVNQPSGTPLYGHLTPALLYKELQTLNEICGNNGALEGLNILITHVKDTPMSIIDPRKTIRQELMDLERTHKLGVVFTILLAGRSYDF